MIGIVTDETKKKILENDKNKLQEEIRERQKQLGLQGMVGLKNQDELQQIEDLEKNASKIQESMEQRNEQRALINKRKKEEERMRRHKEAPERYKKMMQERARMEFEKRRISI